MLYVLPVKVLEGSCPTMQLSLHAIYRVLCHMLNDAQFYPALYTIRMRLAGGNVAMYMSAFSFLVTHRLRSNITTTRD